MVNQNSLDAVSKSTFEGGRFIKPLNDGYAFRNILPTVEALLSGDVQSPFPVDVFGPTARRYKNVILFLIDGFGWQMFERAHKRSASLKEIVDRGVVSQLTAQFPSSTAPAIASLHTGLPVGKHGICEWFYYEPQVDAVIAPILFSLAGNKIRNTLQETGVDPGVIFNQRTFYDHLKKKGVKSSVFMPHEYLPSPYPELLTHGANIRPYKTLATGLEELSASLMQKGESSYTFFYVGKVDALAHKYGSISSDCETEIDSLFLNLEDVFLKKQKESGDTLVLITTDHGQIDIDPAKTIYLNEIAPFVEEELRKTKAGFPIVPVGGQRDMFLHVEKDDSVEKVRSLLSARLEKVADVFNTRSLAKEGFFGPDPNIGLLLEHGGNLIIVPNENNLIWWNKDKKFTVTHKSHHGGFSKDEMVIPFICLPA